MPLCHNVTSFTPSDVVSLLLLGSGGLPVQVVQRYLDSVVEIGSRQADSLSDLKEELIGLQIEVSLGNCLLLHLWVHLLHAFLGLV